MDVKQERLEEEYVHCDPVNIFEFQTTGQLANNEDIKQEIIECEESKLEGQFLDLPIKTDYDSIFANEQFFLPVKKEFENNNNSKTTYFKQETSYCDLPTLKNESDDYPDSFEQSCSSSSSSSKQDEKTLNRSNNTAKSNVVKTTYFMQEISMSEKKINNLLQHYFKSVNVLSFKCNFCSKEFNSQQNLQQHLLIHSNEKTLYCDICFKQFKHKRLLELHLIIHTNKNAFKGDIRAKKFYANSILPSFKCEICSKKFNQNSCYLKHIEANPEKPFVCQICSQKFGQRCGLEQHLLNHFVEK